MYPFPSLNQSFVPCPVITVASWPAYRFLRRQVRWSDSPISFRIFQFILIHTVKGFSVINEAEVDVLLEFSFFFDDPADVGNLISGSSAFSKPSLDIWKFISHTSKIMLKILQTRLQHYMNHELPDVQAGLRKAEEPEIKLPVSAGSSKKQEFQISALVTMPKPWLCGSQ